MKIFLDELREAEEHAGQDVEAGCVQTHGSGSLHGKTDRPDDEQGPIRGYEPSLRN